MLPLGRVRPRLRGPSELSVALLSLLAIAFLLLWIRSSGRRRVLRPVLMLSILLLSSCGGGGTAAPSGTPAGTYTVQATVTTGGASAGTTRTLDLSITVQ